MTLNGFGPFFCIVRRNQRELQLRSYRCRKQQCGGFCLSVWCSSVPEHSVTRTLDRACVWKWPTTDAMAPEVPWHYALWLFFSLWWYFKDRIFVPQLPRVLADLQARIVAEVKNINAPMLTRVWQELEHRIDVCRVTRGAQIEHL